ncbi:MAG: OB-fold domain-containing protein [Verrucomicrobiales bacterium]
MTTLRSEASEAFPAGQRAGKRSQIALAAGVRKTTVPAPMITFLKGTLVDSLPNRAILDINGVGYEVLINFDLQWPLPAPGQAVQLLAHFM